MNFTSIFITKVYAHGHSGLESKYNLDSVFFRHNEPFVTIAGTLMIVALITAFFTLIYIKKIHKNNAKNVSIVQKMAWFYSLMFLITTSLTYIPFVSDDQGNFAGIFKLDLVDDLLHFGSALWAMWASWYAHKEALRYFRIFGLVYTLDGIIGLFTQRGILDFGIWLYEYPNLSMLEAFGANLPHITIGGIAIFSGFLLSSKSKKQKI